MTKQEIENKYNNNLYKKVYWVEKTYNGIKLLNGILIARYIQNDKMIYIVSLNDITSLVVRHLFEFYENKLDALENWENQNE